MGIIPETMVSNHGITPWHRQGTVIDRYLTGAEALILGGLDWTVNEQEVFYAKQGMFGLTYEEIENRKVLVRSDDSEALAVVSNTYEVMQNSELGDIADQLGVNVTTCGSMLGGRWPFLACDLGESPKFDGQEGLHRWLLITTRHDGQGSFLIAGVNARPVCENTVLIALREGQLFYNITHRSGANERLAAAKAALVGIYNGYDEFDAEVERLLAVQVQPGGDINFSTAMEQVFGPRPEMGDDGSSRKQDNYDRRRREIVDIYLSDTCENIRDTGWGLLNAINEWEIHSQGATKGAKRDARTMSKTLRQQFPLTAKAQRVLVSA